MNLLELIHEISNVAEAIENEEIDYKKIASLMSVLKKLIIRFRERAYLSSLIELSDATSSLLTLVDGSESLKQTELLRYLMEVLIEVQKDESINFSITPLPTKRALG